MAENPVKKIYSQVIEEVIQNIREQFIDEGHDDVFLQELKHLWEAKLNASRAVSGAASEGASHARLPVKETGGSSRSHHKDTSSEASSNVDAATRAAVNALPSSIQSTVNSQFSGKAGSVVKIQSQVDGLDDSESEDEDVIGAHMHSSPEPYNDDEEEDEDEAKGDDEGAYEGKEDPEPLNSSDDVSEPDPSEIFETDNVIVCQYDKITRIKNRWKFHLKDGVMNINGKDYLFSKATGEADW